MVIITALPIVATTTTSGSASTAAPSPVVRRGAGSTHEAIAVQPGIATAFYLHGLEPHRAVNNNAVVWLPFLAGRSRWRGHATKLGVKV